MWYGEHVEHPFIRPWAPYRQIVAFNRGDGLWVGDGTAVKPETFTAERLQKSMVRCAGAVGLPGLEKNGPEIVIGHRPYVPKVKPCYLKIQRGLIVATGGAKNGTLAAGWAAHKVGEALS